MLFLNADFWPLFWAVIGGGAVLSGLLTLLVTTVTPAHRHQAPMTAEAAQLRTGEPVAPARAA